jgi:hypothetical protein
MKQKETLANISPINLSKKEPLDLYEESVLRTEMAGLESQEEDAPKRVLFYKTMSWLGQIRPHRRDESWSASLTDVFLHLHGRSDPSDSGETVIGLRIPEG